MIGKLISKVIIILEWALQVLNDSCTLFLVPIIKEFRASPMHTPKWILLHFGV